MVYQFTSFLLTALVKSRITSTFYYYHTVRAYSFLLILPVFCLPFAELSVQKYYLVLQDPVLSLAGDTAGTFYLFFLFRIEDTLMWLIRETSYWLSTLLLFITTTSLNYWLHFRSFWFWFPIRRDVAHYYQNLTLPL